MATVPPIVTAAILLCYAHSARALTTLLPNCTLPTLEEGTAYVLTSSNLRSTFNILWSSLATIMACTYSVLHLNVPHQRNGRDPGWKGDLKWLSMGFGVKMKWSIIAIFAPEWYMLIAASEYYGTRKLRQRLQDLGDSVHGGRQWSINEAFLIGMGGYGFSCWSRTENREGTQLQAKSFVQLLELNPSIVLPQLLNADEVAARSKSDMFTRSIVLMQILYFVVAVISRWIEHQPVSPLEVAALAFTICSFCTYGLYWHKPQGVTAVTIIALHDYPIPESLSAVLEKEVYVHHPLSLFDQLPRLDSGLTRDFLGGSIWLPISACTSAVFSAIHLAAWDSTFPTAVERIIWRVATLVTALVFILSWLVEILVRFDAVWWPPTMVRDRFRSQALKEAEAILSFGTIVVSIILYILARLFLIVEPFRSLAYLPLDAYITYWPANVPHFG
ncbi:hypothetical protein LTR95_013581 [Oleoguttula sp. CCFEE 5521]